jgi:hypothetical protein
MNVIQLHTWTIHLAATDDEWEAACGADEPDMLAETVNDHLPGYTPCPACKDTLTHGS